MRSSKAFTLIELLVVIAIISVLGGLIMVGISGAQETALSTTTANLINSLEGALSVYQDANHCYPDMADTPTSEGRDNPQAMYRGLCNIVEFGGSTEGAPLFQPKMDQVGIIVEEDNSEETGTTTRDANESELGDGTPTGAAPDPDLVIRDSWNNFIHYVEWESRSQNKNGKDYWGNSIKAKYSTRNSYSIWSDGPNGINESGEEDDINNF